MNTFYEVIWRRDMKTEETMKFYEFVKDDLKFHGISSVRIKIMISLNEGPKKTKELRKLIGIQSSTIIHGINELEKQNLVSREVDSYYLSETGKIMVLKIIDMIKTLVVLKNFQKLWLNHDISAIPHDLLMDISDLSYAKLIESEHADVLKPHSNFLQVLLQSKEIRGVSPIFYGEYNDIFKKVTYNNVKVELVLTEDVLNTMIGSLGEDVESLKEMISAGNLTLWKLREDSRIAFTVTDKFLSLGLFTKRGVYDPAKDLVSDHYAAIAWGNRLFDYYRQRSDKFKL